MIFRVRGIKCAAEGHREEKRLCSMYGGGDVEAAALTLPGGPVQVQGPAALRVLHVGII